MRILACFSLILIFIASSKDTSSVFGFLQKIGPHFVTDLGFVISEH